MAYGLPTDWSFWEKMDRRMIERSSGLLVLMLDGWRASTGVRAELDLARQFEKPVCFLLEERAIHR